MRACLVLAFVLVAGVCYADDPLETLNTVEDTVRTMEQTLQVRPGQPEDAAAPERRRAQNPTRLPDLDERQISDELLGSNPFVPPKGKQKT